MTSRDDIIAKLKAEAAEDDGDGDENDLRRECKQFDREVADTKEFSGMWDMYDPVARAFLRVVATQNDVADAYDMHGYGAGDGERMLEAAFKARIEAIAALHAAIKQWPRGP